MLAANEAVAAHLEADAGARPFIASTSRPIPKRVMEFEEVAAHFGYSLGVGAIPVKKFGYHGSPARRPQGAQGDRAAGRDPSISSRQLSEAGGEDRRQAGGAHPELPDAALAEAGALQRRRTSGHFALAADSLYAFHFAHPPLSGSDRAPSADGALWTARSLSDETEMAPIAEECSLTERRAADAERELVEWKKVEVHGGPRSARSSTR